MSRYVGWLLRLQDVDPDADTTTPRRWWSGQEDLTFDVDDGFGDVVWKGTDLGQAGKILDFSEVPFNKELPERRARFRLAAPTLAQRAILTQDLGAITVWFYWIWSDNGISWTRVARSFIGRLSQTSISNGEFTGEVETYIGDIDRGNPEYWAHEIQQDLYPDDNALAQAAILASDIRLRWPPAN